MTQNRKALCDGEFYNLSIHHYLTESFRVYGEVNWCDMKHKLHVHVMTGVWDWFKSKVWTGIHIGGCKRQFTFQKI